MTELIIYLLKVILIQGGLYMCYWLFFRKTLRHQFNRVFLLSALFIAFAIPFIQLTFSENIPIVTQNEQVINWLTEPAFGYDIIMLPIEESSSSISFWFLIPVCYSMITVMFLTRSIHGLLSLNRFKRHSEIIKRYWFNLFKTSHSSPFSFFSNVFIPKALFESEDFDQVLAHECVHVKQRHSVDRLLLDFVVSLFWFNPFIYLYRNALIEIHEYQADEEVVKRFKDPIRYQEILFSQLQSPQYSGMVSHFNVSTIKKRIEMMNKQNKKSGWIYLVILPLSLMMIFAFSSKDAGKPLGNVGAEIANVIGPIDDYIFPEINWNQQDFKPSILPIKKNWKVRMTSGFGMRIHPIYKVEKMHLGIDFSCQVGTPIIASADGVVENIESASIGYGNMITINHGDKYQTRYAQLSEFSVKEGETVKKGQLIALSGNSGASTAPHLHYEVIAIGIGQVDPQPFITNYEFKVEVKEKAESEEVHHHDTLREKERELAEREMHQAREHAERAQIEKIRAEEKRTLASEDAEKAHQLHKVAEKKKEKEKQKEKSKKQNKSNADDPRLSKVYEFLEKYEGDDFDEDNWKIIFKEDRVKLKRVGSLESITLFKGALEDSSN
jgi:murein DD-endopeptidase MepM/ murein hydrolase activator NlpD